MAAQGSGQGSVMLDGVTIAPGVVETIVALASKQTEGVAGVCGRSPLRKKATAPAVDVALHDGELTCGVHIIARHGHVLPEVGKAVQEKVSYALDGQLGIAPAQVDVYIDGVSFEG